MIPSYEKIAREGGAYDTKKYRYVIDAPGEIKRCLLSDLDTTAMLKPDAWKIVKRRGVQQQGEVKP